MGVLENFWDDILGGPGPDTKAKKSYSRQSSMDSEREYNSAAESSDRRSSGEFLRNEDIVRVTKSIPIKKPAIDTLALQQQYSLSSPTSGILNSPPGLMSPLSDITSPSPRKNESFRSSFERNSSLNRHTLGSSAAQLDLRHTKSSSVYEWYYDWYPGST